MPMGEQQHISVGLEGAGDHSVRARPDGSGSLTPGHPVGPERPAGSLDADVRRSPTFVLPVVPFEEVVSRLALVGEAGETAGLDSPSTRGSSGPTRRCARPAGAPASSACERPSFGERDVGAASVTAEPSPLGLAVTDENDLVLRHDRSLPPRGVKTAPHAGATCVSRFSSR